MKKPMNLFLSHLSGRVYATASYKVSHENADGSALFQCTGTMYDVTESFDAIAKDRAKFRAHKTKRPAPSEADRK